MKKYLLKILDNMRSDWDYMALVLLISMTVAAATYVYSDIGLDEADKLLLLRIDQTLEGL